MSFRQANLAVQLRSSEASRIRKFGQWDKWKGQPRKNRVDLTFDRIKCSDFTAKPEKVRPIQRYLKVAAPWGRGDLSAAASGYSISGFAIASVTNAR